MRLLLDNIFRVNMLYMYSAEKPSKIPPFTQTQHFTASRKVPTSRTLINKLLPTYYGEISRRKVLTEPASENRL